MKVSDIINGLRALADELKPFTQEIRAGTRVWNGNAYISAEPRNVDPYALAWWSALTSIADMVERQGGPITKEQREYLRKMLFGGMGSFNDFCIDIQICGNIADETNKRLDTMRSAFYKLFI